MKKKLKIKKIKIKKFKKNEEFTRGTSLTSLTPY